MRILWRALSRAYRLYFFASRLGASAALNIALRSFLLKKEAALKIKGLDVRLSPRDVWLLYWVMRSCQVDREGDLLAIRCPEWGGLAIPLEPDEVVLLPTTIPSIFREYGSLDVRGRRVLDVGGYVGDTALFFVARGASHVTVVEPVESFAKVIERAARFNGLEDKITVLRSAVCNGRLYRMDVDASPHPGSGLDVGGGRACVAPCSNIDDLISGGSFDVAKIDCEGCEYYLLCVSCDMLKRIGEYVVEVHGSPTPLFNRLSECGFRWHRISGSFPVSLWRFYLTGPS